MTPRLPRMIPSALLLASVAAGGLANPALAAKTPVQEAKTPAVLKEVEAAAGHKVVVGNKVQFTTSKGKFVVVLFPKEAPKTVANFEKLVKQGFYDGVVFHRVIPGFVAQGGDPKGTGEGGPGYTIPDELNSTLKHIKGSLAMAKTSQPNSAGSQFYIAYDKIPHLDGRYTVFGQVISGMDVVEKLTPSDAGKPDKMLKVTLLK